MKRTLSIFLSCAILLTCICTGLPAAADYETVATFTDLVSALENSSQIALNADISVPNGETLELPDGLELDGQGHAILLEGSAAMSASILALPEVGSVTLKNLSFGARVTPIPVSSTNACVSLVENDTTDTLANWENVKFYFSRDAQASGDVGGVIHTLSGSHHFVGCATYGTLTGANVAPYALQINGGTVHFENCENHTAVAASGSYAAGFVAKTGNTAASKIVMENCTNFASVTSTNGGDGSGTGGLLGAVTVAAGATVEDKTFVLNGCINQGAIGTASAGGGLIGLASGSATLDMDGCKNFGAVSFAGSSSATVTVYVGGLIGLLESAADLDGCSNHARVTCVGSKSGSTVMAGGLIAKNDVALTFDNCVNHGNVESARNAAGFVASPATSTESGNTYTDCINFGNVTGGQITGGFIALLPGSFIRCLNAGDVTGGQYTGGFVGSGGSTKKITLNDCINIGKITGQGSNYMAGQIAGNGAIDATDVYAFGEVSAFKGPTDIWEFGGNGKTITHAGMVLRYGNVAIDGEAVTRDQALVILNQMPFGIEFMAGQGTENKIVVATPVIRGYQNSVQGNAVRVVATLDSLNYPAAGFVYSAWVGETQVVEEKVLSTTNVLLAVNANEDGSIRQMSAEELCGKYLIAVTFQNVPTEGEITIRIRATAGTHLGTCYELVLLDGKAVSYRAVDSLEKS